ncbi:SH3 domain-containing protein [Rhodopila globiformis]|uniref:SH3b domain-containing protein n=1 Tax=Rhodopila globiformis TaxID=1071 RepID=A0A2S6N2L1_RHOGL|nr:SH3 domain-containing protein [Rhodopila globiformis]PPQ28847.1 hypothetical protein CCS01_22965 [Rhodopila globiformis]
MRWVATILCLLAGLILPHGAALAVNSGNALPTRNRGIITGLPLPRFVSLRSSVVNVRRGPGQRYPIDWVYHRRGLPVQIIWEFETWRQVRMRDGTTGWIHQALLSGQRSFVVSAPEAVLRDQPNPGGQVVARLRQGVIGRLRRCRAASAWCQVATHGFSGFVRRAAIWGSFPGEAVGG